MPKAISVRDRNSNPSPAPRSITAAIMSPMPLSWVEPDSIHIAIMIARMPNGTVAKGASPRIWIR
ncbi:hypothetical protein D9M71_841600 [compost metagenome]